MDYRQLDSMIDALRAQVHAANPQKGYWKELWALAGEIGSGFKGVRYETREAKDAAWKRFQDLRQQANERSEASKREMDAREKDREHRKTGSEQARRSIEGRAAGAQPMSGLDHAIRNIVLSPLAIVERVIGKILGLRAKTEFEEARDELRQCSATLKDAWRTFTDHKRQLLPADKQQCFQTLTRAQERLDEAWTQLKGAEDSFYSAQRAAHEERQRERERKKVDFHERVRANIDKLETNLDKARSALSRQEANLDKLESDYSSAWNDSFRDKCSGWIDEAKDRIADIRANIEKMEGWLEEERRKLR